MTKQELIQRLNQLEWEDFEVKQFRIDLFEIPAINISQAQTRYTYRLPEQENLQKMRVMALTK